MNRKENNIDLTKDFQVLVENRSRIEKEYKLDDYINFVTQVNEFAGHPQRTIQPIIGEKFLL
ncbi:MAG: hypothetical protein AB1798_14580 [Spirochaetota bacterium]